MHSWIWNFWDKESWNQDVAGISIDQAHQHSNNADIVMNEHLSVKDPEVRHSD